MKSKTGWIIAGVLGLVILCLVPSFVMGRFWGRGLEFGHMAGRFAGPGMMSRFGFWNPLGFLGMILMWLIPAGLLVLLVIGAVALVNNLTQPERKARPPAPTMPVSAAQSSAPASAAAALTPAPIEQTERQCANCGQPAQAGWAHCPYCGQALA